MEADDELRWTDDTHMTIGVAESLIARGDFDGADMARRFADHHAEQPWRGYGAGPPRVFAALRAGRRWDEPARELFDGGSYGNGGAMRAAPAGLFRYHDVVAAAELGRRCAAITHAHELGLQGAALQAAAVAWLVGGDGPARWSTPDDLIEAVRATAPAPEFQERLDRVAGLSTDAPAQLAGETLGNSVSAVDAVPASLWAFVANPQSYSDTVTAAILMGGDTDTIAAMAGALCGAHLGATAIPAPWRDRVESADRLVDLADQLHRRAYRPRSVIPPG